MKKIEQLIDKINSIKKDGIKLNKIQEKNYVLMILKEIFGDKCNPGILWKASEIIHPYMFDNNYSLETILDKANNKSIVMRFKDKETGKEYIKALTCNSFGNPPRCYFNDSINYPGYGYFDVMMVEFREDICFVSKNNEYYVHEYDSNGIEIKRTRIEYNVSYDKLDEKSTKNRRTTTIWERDKNNFNVATIYTFNGDIDKKSDERYFDGQFFEHLYSLDGAETFLEPLKHDLTSLLEYYINVDSAYELIPEFKKSVIEELEIKRIQK